MKVLIAGATGQVGKQILNRLIQEQHDIVALVRKPGQIGSHSNLKEAEFNFDDDTSYAPIFEEVKPDLLVIALGTTRKKAGSLKEFLKVDRDIPIRLIRTYQSLSHSPKKIVFVSSIGADKPMGTYLKAKFDVESEIFHSGIPYIIARPSLLVSNRTESRPLEELSAQILIPIFGILRRFFPNAKGIHKYSPVDVERVADAIINAIYHSVGSAVLEAL